MATRQAPHPLPQSSRPPRGLLVGSTLSLSFFIPAVTNSKFRLEEDVVAKERPRFKVITPKGGKPFAQTYTPPKTQFWEDHVATHGRNELLKVELEGDGEFVLPIVEMRVLAHIRFNLRKPASYPKSVVHATKKPDLDNLVKGILDGLVMGRVLGDDNCITDLHILKRYATPDHPPGVEVELTCLPL